MVKYLLGYKKSYRIPRPYITDQRIPFRNYNCANIQKNNKKMANIEKFIPFVIEFEAGVVQKGLQNESLFVKAKSSGFSNDKADIGGATMVGVTIGTFQSYCRIKGLPNPNARKLQSITYQQWREILKTMYWDKWEADKIKNQSVAEILVDWVWASGKYGITIPQKLLNVSADGFVGPKTLSALNNCDQYEIFNNIKRERISFIDRICAKRPANNKFKKGWIRRINAITFEK